jgi:hypothetical protein
MLGNLFTKLLLKSNKNLCTSSRLENFNIPNAGLKCVRIDSNKVLCFTFRFIQS